MTTNLPKGIVTNATSIQRDISDIEQVDIADLIRLWRVYTTNKDVLKNDTGRRLENLFWRILGSDQIRETISGHTVAAIFTKISDASSTIGNPRRPPLSRRTTPLTPPKGIERKKGKEVVIAPPAQPPAKAEPKRTLPPILKTSKRDLVAYGNKSEHVRYEAGTTASDKKDDSKQKKRTSFVAGTRRKRPAPPKRKSSSQTHTPTTPTTPLGRAEDDSESSMSSGSFSDLQSRSRPPLSRSASSLRQTTNSDIDSESVREAKLPRTKSQAEWKVPSYPILTPSVKPQVFPPKSNGVPPVRTAQAVPRSDSAKDVRWERPDSGWLVDQDFRTKFAEKRLSGAASVTKPRQLSSDDEDSSSDSDSEDDSSDHAQPSKPLTRSESQLTLILARDRAERARLEASRARKAKT